MCVKIMYIPIFQYWFKWKILNGKIKIKLIILNYLYNRTGKLTLLLFLNFVVGWAWYVALEKTLMDTQSRGLSAI